MMTWAIIMTAVELPLIIGFIVLVPLAWREFNEYR